MSITATRLRLAANALAPIAATAPAAMIEILCTRLDMIILPGEAACSGGLGLLVGFASRHSRSDYLKQNSKYALAARRMIATRRAPRKPSDGVQCGAGARP